MRGQLVILATGCIVNNFSEDWGLKENKKVESLLENLENPGWHLDNSLFVANYRLFDSRSYQTKNNGLFCAMVLGAVDRGFNIFIVVPDADMVDKRLREQAMILSLPDTGDRNLGD